MICRRPCCLPGAPRRLRLRDGRYIFMEWHSYLGPSFFRDRACEKEIGEWYTDEAICEALEWFQNRGRKA